jgi:hypothetical protein
METFTFGIPYIRLPTDLNHHSSERERDAILPSWDLKMLKPEILYDSYLRNQRKDYRTAAGNFTVPQA